VASTDSPARAAREPAFAGWTTGWRCTGAAGLPGNAPRGGRTRIGQAARRDASGDVAPGTESGVPPTARLGRRSATVNATATYSAQKMLFSRRIALSLRL